MSDIRSSITDISIHLLHNSNMLITIQKRVFLLFPISTSTGRFVGLEAGMREDDDQALCLLICRRNGNLLLGDELRKRRWWA